MFAGGLIKSLKNDQKKNNTDLQIIEEFNNKREEKN